MVAVHLYFQGTIARIIPKIITLNSSVRAVLNEAGTHWILNGAKIWISNGGIAGKN